MALGLSFAFDASRETPDDVKRRRAIADAILGRSRAPQNIGEGFSALADGIVANVQGSRASAAQQAGQESASSAFNPILDAFQAKMTGGFPAAPNPGNTSSMATMPATDTASARVAQAHGDGDVPSQSSRFSGSKQEFIDMLMPAAMEASQRTGVDPRIIVAQAAQETGWGRSAPGNNYFGIKSHGKGGGQTFATHEYVNGKRVNVRDSFRQFDSPDDSVAGYADFLQKNPRYKPLMAAQGLDAQLDALQASGYATDPNYSRSVGSIARGISLPNATAANEAMATGGLSNGLTPEALQQWAFSNYGNQGQQGGAVDAVNALGASQRVGVAENEADILAQEQAMMGQDPQAFAPRPAGMSIDDPMLTWDGRGARMTPSVQNPPTHPNAVPYNGVGAQADIPLPAPLGAQPPMPQAAPSLPDPRMVDDMPVAGIQPQQLAQAGGFPEMAGNTPQAIPSPGPDIGMLLQAASNPWLSDQQRSIVNMMLEQQMQSQDPMRQLDMDYKRAQTQKIQRELSGELGGSAKVQSSVVLDDGSTVMVMNNGQRRVLSPTGEEVTGQAAADAIRSAREYTVQNQQDIYSGRRSGTLGADIELGGAAKAAEDIGAASVKAGMDAWGDYGKLQSSLGNINEAISAIDNGAKSGLVYNMLPNVTEASASLQNAMNRMGLDVIGSVTFGALSEGEMRLAMETAVPRGLQPAELRRWLVRKRDAQEKAAGMLADAAQFLTVPGNTINDWIARNRANSGSTGAPAPRQPVSIGGYTIEQVD